MDGAINGDKPKNAIYLLVFFMLIFDQEGMF